MEEKPKLTDLKSMREKGYLSQCSQFGNKNEHRMMVMTGGGGGGGGVDCPTTN